jgi:FAD-dependent oxidoreductase domain-containing protein 1
MTTNYDVAIIGGGAIGSAIAFFLKSDPTFQGTVAVVERDPTYARASSALSASSIRQQFSTPENIRMSLFGVGFLRNIDRHLELHDGTRVDVGLNEGGYLFLATSAFEDVMRQNHEIQLAEGADNVLLTPGDLATRYPWMSTDDVALGSLGLTGEGWFDGYGLMQAFRRKARAIGTEYLAAEAVAMDLAGGRVTDLHLGDGTTMQAGYVVNAAGPWSRTVAAMAGVELPVEARRRCVFGFDSRSAVPDCPLVIDTSGIWFRPEGEAFITAIAPLPEEDLDGLPLTVEQRQFDERVWPALARRVPAFDAIRQRNAWAGYYEYSTFDQNAIIGAHPELTNLLFASGFSGHGIQHAPAVGRAIAELVVHGRYTSLDLSIFGYERLIEGRPVVERNVIG